MKTVFTGLIALIASAMIAGCGSSDTTYTAEGALPPGEATTSILVSSDNGSSSGLSYTNVGENGILVECGDGDGDCNLAVNSASENVEVEEGVYNASYTQDQCTEAGFFFCTIENACLDQPTSGGSCPVAADEAHEG